MTIPIDRLRQPFSEGNAQEIYHEIKSRGDLIEFTRQYALNTNHRVARNALWGLTKATDKEISRLQILLNELIEQTLQTEDSSVRRLTLNIIERLVLTEDNLRTDFLDFCLEHMAAVNEPPGIQTLCMKLAYRMCNLYPELKEEFKRTIDAMEISYFKPAVKGLRDKILNGKYRKK
ncbi:MAG: hypothetical protein ACI358_03975 [Candidatus Limimorpha sp.]